MSKHTPGPWRVEVDEKGDIGVFADNYGLICYPAEDNYQVNARLIAAAPEMRAFVEQAAKHPCQCDYFYADDNGYPTSDGCLMCDARALLARIDGQDGA